MIIKTMTATATAAMKAAYAIFRNLFPIITLFWDKDNNSLEHFITLLIYRRKQTFMIITVITSLCAAAAAAICVWMISRSIYKSRLEASEGLLRKDHEAETQKLQMEIQAKELLHQSEMKANSELLRRERENYEKALKEMKETVLTSMNAETEKILKAREKELKEDNQANMDGILKPLKESISAMEKAMKDNADTHLKSTTELSAQDAKPTPFQRLLQANRRSRAASEKTSLMQFSPEKAFRKENTIPARLQTMT